MTMQQIQEEADALIKRHSDLVAARSPRETLWRECEKWVDPNQQGGFWRRTPGGQRDQHITDDTARIGADTFVAAMNAMLTPEGERVSLVQTTDQDLNADPKMARWLQIASDRLHACRNAPHTGFAAQNSLRWRMLGIYGWGGFWTDEVVGQGLFYQAIHPSELYLDDNFRGAIDTIHRRRTMTARHMAQAYGEDSLPERVTKALEDNRGDAEFTVIHILRPNDRWEAGRIDSGRFPIQSIHICEEAKGDAKAVLAVKGYHSMPMSVSRYSLSPHDVYGVGPAGSCIGSIKMLNVMNRDLIRATHLGMTPPILMPSDGSITRMQMTPAAPIPGGMANGKRQIEPFISGVNVAYTKETFNDARQFVQACFLVHVFAIMNEAIDRQTATEFLGRKREAMMMQAPYAGRQIAEALVPQTRRELDILLRARQIPPPPPVFHEAKAGIMFEMDNPFTRAAKSADAQNFMNALQMLEPMAQLDPGVFDVIDIDAAPRGLMSAMGVRADWLSDPDAAAGKRQQRAQQQEIEQLAAAAPAATQAMLNMAKARATQPVAA